MLTETERSILADIQKWVKEKFVQGTTSHSWDHIKRVLDNAIMICRAEGGDEFLVRLAALLHDLGRIPEAKNTSSYIYKGCPIRPCRHRWHAVLSVYEAAEKIRELKKTGILSSERCRELRYMIHMHGEPLSGSSRETNNFRILKDADMIDSFGLEGILRNLLHSKRAFGPLWAPGLAVDLPENRPLTLPEAVESGLGNLQFVYNFRLQLVFKSSLKLAKPQLALNKDILQLLRNEINSGNIPEYDFWIGFVKWARDEGLNRLTDSSLEKFKLSHLSIK